MNRYTYDGTVVVAVNGIEYYAREADRSVEAVLVREINRLRAQVAQLQADVDLMLPRFVRLP